MAKQKKKTAAAPRKKKSAVTGKHVAISLAAVAAALILFCLWYTRPMTIEELCPGLELSQCREITSDSYLEGGQASPAEDHLVLTPEAPQFTALMELFEGRTFRRSILSLFPRGSWTHNSSLGEFKWRLSFHFDNVTLPDGSTASGDILGFNNFFGKMEIYFDDATWRASTGDMDQWLRDVMNILYFAGSGATVSIP